MVRSLSGAVLVLSLAAETAAAQPVQTARLLGQRISGHIEWNAATQRTTDTATFGFGSEGDSAALTIDFVTTYAGQRPDPSRPPSIVDMVVTINEAAADIQMSVDSRALPITTRLGSHRSVVASITFDEFIRLASAGAIVERAFDREMVFGPAQLRTLGSVAARWAGRAAR